jgi:hypothetical protein
MFAMLIAVILITVSLVLLFVGAVKAFGIYVINILQLIFCV